MTVPISRFVNVNVDRLNRFPAIKGFGIPIFLTTETKVGILDASNLTAVYGSIDEVAVDWVATDEFYIAALAAFGQEPAPLQIKAGFLPAIVTPAAFTAAIAAIYAADTDWYWIDVIDSERDTANISGLISWAEANRVYLYLTSNDVLTEDSTDTTCVAAVHKGTVERTAVFYHTDATKYPGFAQAAKLGTFNFDQEGSAYTAKFKKINDLASINKNSAIVQAITGFVPEIGQSVAAGHCANTYVDTGGLNLTVEGSTLTPNVFIDEIHGSDWLASRMEEEMLGILLNNDRVPYDHRGMETLADGAKRVMSRAFRAGLVAEDEDSDGNYQPAYDVIVPDVFSVSDAQRKARIAPAIQVNFRYAGAIHYVTVNITMRF